MIDFFHKGAAMTKKITGIAKLKGAPVVNSRPLRKFKKIATFYRGEENITSILLEIADTEESRRQGLMGRKDLPAICGMLFEGLHDGGYFWMKDCLVPIDVIFFDNLGNVTKTYSMPVDKTGSKHYHYDDDDVTAIEVAEGFVDKWGLTDECRVEIRSLRKGSSNG